MRIHENSVTITKSELRALAAHASKDETRAHLNCVCFDFSNGVAVSTDGHRMAKVASPTQSKGGEFLLPLSAANTILKSLKRAKHAARLTPEKGGKWHVEVFETEPDFAGLVPVKERPASTSTFSQVDSSLGFPPYAQVIPPLDRPMGKVPIGVNPRYLADLVLVQDAGAVDHKDGITLRWGDELDPVLCTLRDWTVVIMPMRI